MIKRTIDLLISSLGLLMLFPVIALLSLLIILDIGFPVIFSQQRIGYRGKTFKIYKFRTMKESIKDEQNEILRLTPLTNILRNMSLDELPTLVNVLKGDMSIVGPRPLLEEYRNEYTKEQFKRHDVQPGITGWAQINGRNAISWEEKFKLDLWYIRNNSLIIDIKIICLTFINIFKKDGINQSNNNTMERFRKKI